MQRKRNTFYHQSTNFFLCLWNECCDQGLVYADNMSITPLLFYFAPEAEIGSKLWKIQGLHFLILKAHNDYS